MRHKDVQQTRGACISFHTRVRRLPAPRPAECDRVCGAQVDNLLGVGGAVSHSSPMLVESTVLLWDIDAQAGLAESVLLLGSLVPMVCSGGGGYVGVLC